MAVRNSFTRLVPQAAAVFGNVVGGNPPTLTVYSGDLIADQGNVSISRSNTGIYVITVTNFRGQRQSGKTRLCASATPTVSSMDVAVTTEAYTNDSAAFTFTVTNSTTGAAAENGFDFQLYAF